jgi:hypothetical protein
MSSVLVQEVIKHLEALPQNLQEQVLSLVRALDSTQERGGPGEHFLQFAGAISTSDLDAMSKAIEQGCEQVDIDEW